ncbi:cytoplasm protein [Moniliophthora roreri]|uniref:PH domain-containing protein n=1 Tax=Moniliophthora roreri TaxID=221103 RepID=A0A0W0FYC4_MONRR|nr:cytoplasm protein [Moniliophthora roreri]
MNNTDNHSLSRATSISRASGKNSSLSRSASLIKKNIQPTPNDLRPSDILIERFTLWKSIIKQLIAYFEGIADIHNNTAKELTKLSAVIQVPFRGAGNQFLGEGGMQDIFYGIRDKSRSEADQHAQFARTVDGSIVQHLEKLRVEVKAHIKNIQNDTGKLATTVARERALSTSLISHLATSISQLKNTPLAVASHPKSDPFIANLAVAQQLKKQVHAENLLQKSIIITQQNSAHFEAGVVRAIQSAWATYEEWHSRMSESISEIHTGLATTMAALAPDREWLSFSARTDHLLDPETPLRNPDTILYPSKDDPSVLAVHTGILERKKRFTRTYREAYYVLTPAGFLHEFTSSDPAVAPTPVFSLFLPACTLGPPSDGKRGSHKFHIEGRRDGGNNDKGAIGSIRKSLRMGRGGGEHAWSFRARSKEDMMEWWNDVRMLCARYLVASEAIERSGPVEAAVRAAGYVSEPEGSDDEEGSSVEEEEEDEEEYEDVAEEAGAPPSYGGHEREKSLPGGVGENGYPIDKKPHPDEPIQDGEASVSRRPSKRQMEKAPEGRPPHVPVDGADLEPEGGAAGATGAGKESRFTEEL